MFELDFLFSSFVEDGIETPFLLENERRYSSPIMVINQEIRRKNGVVATTASGFHSINPNSSGDFISSADPWDYSSIISPEVDNPFFTEDSYDEGDSLSHDRSICVCEKKIRLNSYSTGNQHSSPIRASRIIRSRRASENASTSGFSHNDRVENDDRQDNLNTKVCSRCGKKKCPESKSFDWSNAYAPSGNIKSAREPFHDDPLHADALLQTTPHLRFLSQASTNMQGNGVATGPTNIFLNFMKPLTDANKNKANSEQLSSIAENGGGINDYRMSLIRNRANKHAANELASLLWLLAHEMSIEDFGTVESEVFKLVFALVHSTDKDRKMAGLAALDALLYAPSADEEKKSIKFANTLSNGLRVANGDYEFVSAVSQALGHMALRTANVDFVESEVTRALEWLRTERSDRRYVSMSYKLTSKASC